MINGATQMFTLVAFTRYANTKAVKTMMKKAAFIFSTVFLFLTVNSAFATGSLRCGGQIVDQGMTKNEVIGACGEPTDRKEGDTYWFYDLGSDTLVTRVFFVGDKVEFIDDVARDEM
jgi:hypothetical protein